MIRPSQQSLRKRFDTEQFRPDHRERSKEHPFIAGDYNSEQGERKLCPPEQAPIVVKHEHAALSTST
ncbi:hypothetical protein ACTXT7_016880 [Hymenolepis weldensis]